MKWPRFKTLILDEISGVSSRVVNVCIKFFEVDFALMSHGIFGTKTGHVYTSKEFFTSRFLGKIKPCDYHIYGIQILVKNNKRVVHSSASLIGHYPNPQISDSVKLTYLTYRIEGE